MVRPALLTRILPSCVDAVATTAPPVAGAAFAAVCGPPYGPQAASRVSPPIAMGAAIHLTLRRFRAVRRSLLRLLDRLLTCMVVSLFWTCMVPPRPPRRFQ